MSRWTTQTWWIVVLLKGDIGRLAILLEEEGRSHVRALLLISFSPLLRCFQVLVLLACYDLYRCRYAHIIDLLWYFLLVLVWDDLEAFNHLVNHISLNLIRVDFIRIEIFLILCLVTFSIICLHGKDRWLDLVGSLLLCWDVENFGNERGWLLARRT